MIHAIDFFGRWLAPWVYIGLSAFAFRVARKTLANEAKNSREMSASIAVQLTDESEAHCLKIVFQTPIPEQPLEIFLHTTQAINLAYQLSVAICELHHRDSEMLLRLKTGGTPLIVER